MQWIRNEYWKTKVKHNPKNSKNQVKFDNHSCEKCNELNRKESKLRLYQNTCTVGDTPFHGLESCIRKKEFSWMLHNNLPGRDLLFWNFKQNFYSTMLNFFNDYFC